MSPFLFAVYIECLRESGFGIMAFILAVYSVDVYYMVTTLYFFVLAVIVSGSYWIFVGTMVLNGTQSSLQARVLLVFFGGRIPTTGNVQFFLQELQWSTRVKYLRCQFKCDTCETDT